ncbi:hypothetical protein MASR2M48_32280 [Spirochaetota bacterium]
MRFLVLSILAVTVILTLFLGFSAFLRARRKGRYYALSMLFLGASTYAAFYLAELLQTTMAGILICLPFEYLGVAILTVSMYFVIRDFRGRARTRLSGMDRSHSTGAFYCPRCHG